MRLSIIELRELYVQYHNCVYFQGGSEILESLGYTEYTGFALQYPRSVAPEFFADHIGNLTVELVLASVEISTLLIRQPPTLETLAILREAEAFPGNDPEGIFPFCSSIRNSKLTQSPFSLLPRGPHASNGGRRNRQQQRRRPRKRGKWNKSTYDHSLGGRT